MVAHPGLAFGEMFDLDALSAESNADEIYEFMFAASPLPITGASGSPVSALATSLIHSSSSDTRKASVIPLSVEGLAGHILGTLSVHRGQFW